MIEYLVDGNLIEIQEPPRMNYGKFWTFKGYNLFGVGQQAVHNAGSSMMTDTPTFKKKVVEFIHQHIEFDTEEFVELIKLGKEHFYEQQKERLIRFEKDKNFRRECLQDIISESFDFKDKIKCSNFEIAIMLYFIKEYNYLLSTKAEHRFTKDKMSQFYADSDTLLNAVFEKLVNEEDVGYLLDICYGRYYFLELHFKFRSDVDNKIRNTPMSIINEFFEIGLMKTGAKVLDYDEQEEIVFQKKIDESEGYSTQADIDAANNRKPELNENSNSRYKTNTRLAKTIIKRHNYLCEIDGSHISFINRKGKQYMEAHHLLPMSSQKDFLPANIDREENIVSICPNCHRAIHYGSIDEKRERLSKLYDTREKGLKQSGINVSKQELLKLYKVDM